MNAAQKLDLTKVWFAEITNSAFPFKVIAEDRYGNTHEIAGFKKKDAAQRKIQKIQEQINKNQEDLGLKLPTKFPTHYGSEGLCYHCGQIHQPNHCPVPNDE